LKVKSYDMKIGELADTIGINTSKIRFYERRGLLPTADRSNNGYRAYSERAVQTLKFIELAQQLGFTLAEIADAIPKQGVQALRCADAVVLLRTKAVALDELIKVAVARRSKIEILISELEETRTHT